MTAIQKIELVSAPPTRTDWELREYPSPNGEWSLVLHGEFEWHMGATGWKAAIYRGRKNVSKRHEGMLGMAGSKGFFRPDELQPWAWNNRVLALITWESENPIYVYDVERRAVDALQSGTVMPYSLQFAPDVDRLLLSFRTGGKLYDHRGVPTSSPRWNVPAWEAPFVFWTHGGQFIWIGRESKSSATLLRIYSGIDGKMLATAQLEPRDIVPYERELYEKISRTGYSLRWARGGFTVGDGLDRWNQVRFDRSTNRLLLSVYRPVSPPYQDRLAPGLPQTIICDVEERWVAATLASS